MHVRVCAPYSNAPPQKHVLYEKLQFSLQNPCIRLKKEEKKRLARKRRVVIVSKGGGGDGRQIGLS